jgi:hypothetical protein
LVEVDLRLPQLKPAGITEQFQTTEMARVIRELRKQVGVQNVSRGLVKVKQHFLITTDGIRPHWRQRTGGFRAKDVSESESIRFPYIGETVTDLDHRELEVSKQEIQGLRAEVESLRRGRPSQGAVPPVARLPLRPERPAVRVPEGQVDGNTAGYGDPRSRPFAQGNGMRDGQPLDGFGRPMMIGHDDPRKRQKHETRQ